MTTGNLDRSVNEVELVEAAREGDQAAFERLVMDHLPVARYVARSLMHDDEDAEDVCQEAFLAAVRHIDQCRSPERFQAWLLAIVRHCAHAALEKRAASLRPPPPTPDEDPGHGVGVDPSVKAQVAEMRDHLRAALNGLTQLQREVVTLHDLDGWKHREIADQLGITEGSSRVCLHAAHRTLRNRLHKYLTEV